MWQLASQRTSSPGCVWARMEAWFDMVPDDTNRAASLPSSAATRCSRWLTVGSSPKTSSPTSAAAMAARMPAVGRVTVSLRKSTKLSGMMKRIPLERTWPLAAPTSTSFSASGLLLLSLTRLNANGQDQPLAVLGLVAGDNGKELAALCRVGDLAQGRRRDL